MTQEARRGLAALAGEWQIARRITEASGAVALFDGQARFAWDAARGPGWMWQCEAGELRLDAGRGPAFRAERRYLWQDTGAGLAVHFEDGRFFHAFAALEGSPEAHHHCPPDDYAVRYEFTGWPVWRAVWQVSGPRKDYRMESRFTPLPGGAGGAGGMSDTGCNR